MTRPSTKAAEGTGGVHRLIDMVVEEVSLVDRAANKHRFLIVKRDDSMDDNTPETDTTPKTAADGPDSAVLAALESLTAIVELLGSLGPESSDTRLSDLAEQLRATAEQILERTGVAPSNGEGDADAPDEVQARAKTDEPAEPAEPAKPAEPSTFASNVARAKQALSRLAELACKPAPAATEKREVPGAAEPSTALDESLAKLAESFRSLSETVKEQQQRLGRVEKQFGLPNSAAPAEQLPATNDEDVGWPLDLNKPKDRENVDKAVSFHDL